jgi:hypothetical protein
MVNLADIENMTEEELKNIQKIMEANKLTLTPKERLELFWISVKLLDLDEENRKRMWYDVMELDKYDYVADEEDYEPI